MRVQRRRQIRRGVGLLGIAMTLALANVATAQNRTPFKVGEAFPDRAMPSVGSGVGSGVAAGHLAPLAAYRGKKVVLHVFASW